MSVPKANKPPRRGDPLWHLGALLKFHVTGDDTAGRFWVAEHWAPRDHGPPMHRHDHEDELFVMLDGQLSVSVDGGIRQLDSGETAFAPRNVNHTFKVRSPTARFLVVGAPAGFECWFARVGQAATDDTLPPPAVLAELQQIAGSPDFAKTLLEYGVEVIGPPLD